MPTTDRQQNLVTSLPWSHLRIPPFPQIAVRVMQLAGNEDVSMRGLSDLIAKDAAFASEVLMIANSALYGSRVPIKSILQAVAILGTNSLRGVCLTVGVRAYMGKALHHASLRAIWRHSLACGLASEELASACSLNKDVAYTAGVLHDIGRTALAVMRPREYAALLSSHSGPPASILPSERQLFGVDHCEAGLQLVEQWNLPAELRAAVAEHHDAGVQTTAAWSFSDLIRVSCRIADLAGFAVFSGCAAGTWNELLDACPEEQRAMLPADLESFAFTISSKINSVELAG